MADAPCLSAITGEVTVVVARIKIPVGTLAGFCPGDRMEIESRSGLSPVVTFEVNGKQIASAALAKNGELLIARLTAIGSEPRRVAYDRWLIRKKSKDEA